MEAMRRRMSVAPVGGKHTLLAVAGVIFGLGLAIGTAFEPALPFHAPSIRSAFFATSAIAPSRAPRPFDSERTYPAEVVRVIDGDTFEARVHVWPGLDVTTKVRLRNIDAAELHARCAAELRKAEAARAALQTMLAAGGVTISRVGLDKYAGRIDALVATRDADDISAAMLSGGFARAYGGGRRGSWC
jgi:endonuclease YncB( thermonuclease family)